jgi:hypothetical protein
MTSRLVFVRSMVAVALTALAVFMPSNAQADPRIQGSWTCGPGFNDYGSFAKSDTIVIQTPVQTGPTT